MTPPAQAEFELMVARLLNAHGALVQDDWRYPDYSHVEKMLAQVLDAYRMAREG